MWKTIRVTILLLVLLGVALSARLERVGATSWNEPLWVGVYPLSDGSPIADRYVAALTRDDFSDIEKFFSVQAPRFGRTVEPPVRIELYPASSKRPPVLAPGSGALAVAWWSLQLRWFAMRAAQVPGRARPRIRLFVIFHDPASLRSLPDSHGMQKGLVGVVQAFADAAMAGSNDIVIAHELLHTLGATDKYVPGTGAPVFPDGFADPQSVPLYPQARAEIMAGRRALSSTQSEMPASLREVIVGPMTAAEIRWSTR